MEFSKDQIELIKEYSGYLLKPDQIAMLIGVNPDEFKMTLRNKKHPGSIAYETGKAETILEIRKQEIQLAKLGSPIALDLVSKFIIEQKQGER